jgi:hypothetical protein
MDVPKYLQVLWSYAWLLVIGLVAAAVAGFFSANSIVDGSIQSRIEHSYSAGTTMLVTSDSDTLYQAEIPGEAIPEGKTPPQERDLTATTVIYAYVVAGAATREAVEAELGPLNDTEDITALRRTTQPGGDEQFPGRLTLPILEVVGTSDDPARAEAISATATKVFQEGVADQQNGDDIPKDERVVFQTLDTGAAIENEGSNPIVPIAVTAAGVFLVFVALAFVLYNIRSRRVRRRTHKASRGSAGTGVAPGTDTGSAAPVGVASAAPASVGSATGSAPASAEPDRVADGSGSTTLAPPTGEPAEADERERIPVG